MIKQYSLTYRPKKLISLCSEEIQISTLLTSAILFSNNNQICANDANFDFKIIEPYTGFADPLARIMYVNFSEFSPNFKRPFIEDS